MRSLIGNPAEPLVSIVLVTRNRPGELCISLAFLEKQSYPNWELILIDDCSDPALDLPSITAPAGFQPIRNQSPIGYIRSRQIGFSLARGELLLLLDDDSSFTDPSDLRRAVERMRKPNSPLEHWRSEYITGSTSISATTTALPKGTLGTISAVASCFGKQQSNKSPHTAIFLNTTPRIPSTPCV